jgi:hypothetical protein
MDMKKENEVHLAWATEVLKKTGSFATMAIIDCEQGRVPFVIPFGSVEEKQQMLRVVQLFCIAHNASALTVMAESWITTISADGSSQKTEAMVISAVHRDGRELVTINPIERDAAGAVVTVHADAENASMIENAFRDVLPRHPLPAAARREAHALLTKLTEGGFAPTVH